MKSMASALRKVESLPHYPWQRTRGAGGGGCHLLPQAKRYTVFKWGNFGAAIVPLQDHVPFCSVLHRVWCLFVLFLCVSVQVLGVSLETVVLRKSFTSVCRSSADILVMFFFNFILGFVIFSSAHSRLRAKILQTFPAGLRSPLNIIMCDSLSHCTLVCHYYYI